MLGGVVWAAGSVLLGYLAGESWRAVEHWVGRGGLIVALLIVVTILVVRHRRKAKKAK